MYDIKDANVYKSFKTKDGLDFCSDPTNLSFMLNFDFFNPFKHSTHSVGVLYLTLNNLPRECRFKFENTFILGIIPGPHEPSLNINSFLKPFVDELLIFWNEGKYFNINGQLVKFKAAICADVPATRECLGFLANNAIQGCSKCLKKFPRNENNIPNYSGFEDAPRRSGENVRELGFQWLSFGTQADRNAFEKLHGIRYSELMRIPYLDTVRFHTIDPLHNIF